MSIHFNRRGEKEFKERGKYLVDNYLRYDGRYKDDPKDNKSVREHFIEKMIPSYYTKVQKEHLLTEMHLDKVKEYLARTYGD